MWGGTSRREPYFLGALAILKVCTRFWASLRISFPLCYIDIYTTGNRSEVKEHSKKRRRKLRQTRQASAFAYSLTSHPVLFMQGGVRGVLRQSRVCIIQSGRRRSLGPYQESITKRRDVNAFKEAFSSVPYLLRHGLFCTPFKEGTRGTGTSVCLHQTVSKNARSWSISYLSGSLRSGKSQGCEN